MMCGMPCAERRITALGPFLASAAAEVESASASSVSAAAPRRRLPCIVGNGTRSGGFSAQPEQRVPVALAARAIAVEARTDRAAAVDRAHDGARLLPAQSRGDAPDHVDRDPAPSGAPADEVDVVSRVRVD